MVNKRRSFLGLFIVLAFILIGSLLLFFGGNYVLSIPNQALDLYGQPSQSLSVFEHYELSFRLIKQKDLIFDPVDPNGKELVFSVESGESTASILSNLDFAGLIYDQEALRDYLVYSGLDTRLQAGIFILSPAMSPIIIVNTLIDPTPKVMEFNILPGWRIEEIAVSLSFYGSNFSPHEFIQATFDRPAEISFIDEIPIGVSLEGYFSPGSYLISRKNTAEELVMMFLQAFEEQLTLELLDAFRRQGLTLHQAVTLASMVERESIVDEEQPMIASVFLNRLAIDMRLESDPTVQYALGYNEVQDTWWTNPISLNQLQVDSPYNTYRYPGLMPSPIANPSMSALQAVAYPAQTPYYFFRATCDHSGRHNFSQTFEEHVNYGCP